MPPSRHLCAALLAALCTVASAPPAAATAPGNGRLRIIQLDVGQGDGALIITPNGQVAVIDNGPNNVNAMGVSLVNQLKAYGVTSIEHHFASHYHADHISATGSIISGGIPIAYGWDRGGTYGISAFYNYASALGTNRRTLVKNQIITLDSLSAHPVTITCVDLAGAGVNGTQTDENNLCVVLKISYGEFDAVYGGDLPGANTPDYADIESTVGPETGVVELYKVHHHGSASSTNSNWLIYTTPKVAIISCGNGNTYGHPTVDALTRLHIKSVKTYWTELGTGASPDPSWDKVANGQVIVSATWEESGIDTIRGNGFADTFTNSFPVGSDVTPPVVSVDAPDGGEVWKAGSFHNLTWTATDNAWVASVDLSWSTDGGTNWSPVATAINNTGVYSWKVPNTATTNGRVRVVARDAAGNLGRDSSAASFTVDFWTITASAGLGGSINPSGVVTVSQGAGKIFSSTAASGCQFSNLLLDGVPVGAVTPYLVPNVTAHHTLSAVFTDITAPAVALSSPVGGEAWLPGELRSITWSASDNLVVDSVDVDFSAHEALGPWNAIAHGLANSGTYGWTLPAVNTDSALVRVTVYDRARNSASAMSAGRFTIGTGSTAVGGVGPAVLALAAPMPNPSVSATRLEFSLPQEGTARLEVIDISGRRVWSAAGTFASGPHRLVWDGHAMGGNVQAGVYLVRLVTPWGTRTARFVRLK